MTVFLLPDGRLSQIDEHVAALRRLLGDLEELRLAGVPPRSVLDDATYLDKWSLAQHTAPCLKGYPTSHPHIQLGHLARTSDLWVFAPDQGYARTFTRYYRLGTRAEPKASYDHESSGVAKD